MLRCAMNAVLCSHRTSQYFLQMYESQNPGTEPLYQGASMFASLCALATAMEDAGSLTTEEVRSRRLRVPRVLD